MESLQNILDRKIWLRAFYGFDPEGSGYIGFTRPGDQQTMLSRMTTGDLVLIYGAVEDLTEQDLRAQALGFLEVEAVACDDRSRMSEEAYQWKLDRGFQERWTNGIKVTRAWRVRNRVGIKSIAPDAYAPENRFERTTRAILLNEHERERALSHPVRQVNVFGEVPISPENLGTGPLATIWAPSKGPRPTFGKREANFEDGETWVYLMMLVGPTSAFLGRQSESNSLFKVGRSNDPKRRLKELNCGFPPSAVIRWKMLRSERFPDADTAHQVEQAVHAALAARHRSEGGEFFTGPERSIESTYSTLCTSRMHRILGASTRATGI